MNDSATLKRIRELADRATALGAHYKAARVATQAHKATWEATLAELQDLCRSHETSEEVASRPLIRACEERVADGEGDPSEYWPNGPNESDIPDDPTGGIVDALDRMREAGGKARDDVADPEAYLAGEESKSKRRRKGVSGG